MPFVIIFLAASCFVGLGHLVLAFLAPILIIVAGLFVGWLISVACTKPKGKV